LLALALEVLEGNGRVEKIGGKIAANLLLQAAADHNQAHCRESA
jgi:hypothetical protein